MTRNERSIRLDIGDDFAVAIQNNDIEPRIRDGRESSRIERCVLRKVADKSPRSSSASNYN